MRAEETNGGAENADTMEISINPEMLHCNI